MFDAKPERVAAKETMATIKVFCVAVKIVKGSEELGCIRFGDSCMINLMSEKIALSRGQLGTLIHTC